MALKTENLLYKDCSVSIHRRNVRSLVIEMYKVKNGSWPEIIKKNFPLREDNHCNLCQDFQIIVAHINWKWICLLYSADNLGINTFWINSKEPITYGTDFIQVFCYLNILDFYLLLYRFTLLILIKLILIIVIWNRLYYFFVNMKQNILIMTIKIITLMIIISKMTCWKAMFWRYNTDLSTCEICSTWEFDDNNIQNTIILGDAVENSLTSKLLLFTSRLFKRLA